MVTVTLRYAVPSVSIIFNFAGLPGSAVAKRYMQLSTRSIKLACLDVARPGSHHQTEFRAEILYSRRNDVFVYQRCYACYGRQQTAYRHHLAVVTELVRSTLNAFRSNERQHQRY